MRKGLFLLTRICRLLSRLSIKVHAQRVAQKDAARYEGEPLRVERYVWSRLNKQQLGAYAEYFVKMELTMYGFQVYSTEVDDRGIDFVARHESGPYIEIQVKSLRGLGYVYLTKAKFALSDNLHLALVLFADGKQPDLYLIPSRAWESPNALVVSRDYGEGLTSDPEWGLNLSSKNMAALEPYRFERSVAKLCASGAGA